MASAAFAPRAAQAADDGDEGDGDHDHDPRRPLRQPKHLNERDGEAGEHDDGAGEH